MPLQTKKFGCRCLLTLVIVMSHSVWAFAGSSPQLQAVSPRGIERGAEHTLQLRGLRLDDAQEVFFYDEGITTKSLEVINPKKLEVVVDVAADCRLGEHILQVHCGKGVSDFRSIFVGPYPAVAEKEPNNDFDTAQRIELNQTATGKIRAEDQDFFVVSLKAGTRLSVEVEAIRLGTFFDSLVSVFGADKNEIAVCDDTQRLDQDGFVSVIAPVDGDYYVMIRDVAFASVNDADYRLHVGDFDCPRVMFPAGGKEGEDLKTEMLLSQTATDRASGTGAAANNPIKIKLPDDSQSGEVFGNGPSALPLRVSDFKNFARADDSKNFNFQTALEVPIPVAINGRLNEPGKRHYYSFHAKKNQKLSVDVFAKRIGSQLDPIVSVFNDKRKSLVGSDDGKIRPDSFLVFDPPADGVYSLRLLDYFGRGGEDMIYRIEIVPVDPSLSLNIKRNDRFSQTRMAMAVPQGGRFGAVVSAKKEYFSSDVELLFEGLPEGVTATTMRLKKNANELPVVFEAAKDSKIDLSLVTVSAKAVDATASKNDESKPKFTTKFTATSLDSRGPPNNFVYHPTVVEKLAVGVVEPLPFSITVEPMKAPLLRNGSARVKVIAHRNEGFKEKIRLQFPYRSPGVGTTYQIEMKPDQTEIDYPINANKGAQLGKWPFYVIATANVRGPAWTSSQLQTLSVEEPFVAIEAKRTVCARNASVKIVCNIEQLREFTGEATAELKSLPPHVTVAGPQAFDKVTQAITFELKTSNKTPFGQHKSIFVEVSIPVGDGRSVARAGSVVLQVNRPLKPEPKVALGGTVR